MSAETPPIPNDEARRVFAAYVARVRAGGVDDFAELCARNPALAGELLRLHEAWKRAETRAAELSVSARLQSLVGKDLGVRVALEGSDTETRWDAPGPGIRIGRYRLRSEVARGGQGAILGVYDEDLRRNLAMKVILGGDEEGSSAPASSIAPKALGRFLEEAQVTAQLDHPGIVPVHELGLDSEGRVYFTMRLVKGEDLGAIYEKTQRGEDGWSRTRALGVLVKVCEAMSYAHHKGVIHRDLKPANVMVGGFGEVYVMDWGLARVLAAPDDRDLRIDEQALASGATHDDLDDPDAIKTMDGDIVGTPSFMPPEQAVGELAAMGPHSDVYSVGAMLYTLLAGHKPYVLPGERPSLIDIVLAVQSKAPHPLAERAPDAPDELVAICEKAMAREPAARYPDMSGLAEDLRAFLEGRVVAAYERGAVAELRKWVARNRPLAGAMAAGVLALVAGLATTLVQKRRADRNATLAHERELLAIDAEAKATAEAERANAEARRANAEAERANDEAETARQTADFLVGLFEVVDPGEARGNTITAREILDRGARRIEAELGDRPGVQSALMGTMGTVYKSLGLYDEAVPLLERSLARRLELHGENDLSVSDALTDLGEVRRLKAEYAEAEPLLRRALELRRASLGDRDASVAKAMHELGIALTGQNRLEEAEELFRGSLELRRELLGRHPDVAESLNALAFCLYDQGDREAAEPLLRESLEIRQELLGEHPDTAESINDLGVYLFERGEIDQGEELMLQALEMKRRIYTEVHPEMALGYNNLAVAYHSRGALDEAEDFYLKALGIQRRLLGESHPDIAQALHNVAILRQNKGDWDGAKELFLDSLAMYVELHGEGHPSVARPLQNTLDFLRELAEKRRSEDGEASPAYALELVELAGVLVLAGGADEALDQAFHAQEILAGADTVEPWQAAWAESALGAALMGTGELEEAEELLRSAFEVLDAAKGRECRETQTTVRRLVALYEMQSSPEAERFRGFITTRAKGG